MSCKFRAVPQNDTGINALSLLLHLIRHLLSCRNEHDAQFALRTRRAGTKNVGFAVEAQIAQTFWHPVGIYLRKVTRPCAGYRMGIAGCALGRVNVCRSGFRSSSWWSAPRRWSSQLTPRTTAAQRTQSASWLSARPNRVTARRLFCFASLVIVLVRGRQRAREGAQRSSAATRSESME